MLSETQESQALKEARPRWFNSPVHFSKGNLSKIRQYIPDFERRSFGLTQSDGKSSRLNEHLDMIVRMPFGVDQTYVPIALVSKSYSLVQHSTVWDQVAVALEQEQISPQSVSCELGLTRYGERMALSVYLPSSYDFDPGDGHPMSLWLECCNSVDGSCRFRALMGWFRLVCSNGLTIRITRSDLRRIHIGDLRIDDIGAVLTSGLIQAEVEKKNFEGWRKKEISVTRLIAWIEKELWKAWGFKAATRTFHIARTGSDVEILRRYKGNSPTTIKVKTTNRVPGAPAHSGNLFDVSQILAWLAKERHDLQERLEWREQIPRLITPLLR